MLNEEQISLLEKPLDWSRVKYRQGGGGKSLAYLEGHDVIEAANRIFRPGSWGFTTLETTLEQLAGASGQPLLVYYVARVCLEVEGCKPITEEGMGEVNAKSLFSFAEHEKGRKGAITDALKRALRVYGNQFGLPLYDKEFVADQNKQQHQQASAASTAISASTQQRSSQSNPRVYPSAPASAPAATASQTQAKTTNASARSGGNGNSGSGSNTVTSARTDGGNTAAVGVVANQPKSTGPDPAELITQAKRLATARHISTTALEKRCQELYGVGLERLGVDAATDLLDRLKAVNSEATSGSGQTKPSNANAISSRL